MVRTRFFKRRAVRVALPSLVLCGVLAGVALFAGSAAQAAACSTSTPINATDTPNSCTILGELDLTAGSLSLVPPPALSWADTLNGMEQYAYDSNSADQKFTVNDATGSGAGWNVTVAAATFTSGPNTLPAAAFTVNGSLSNSTVGTAPHIGCTSGTSCTVADNTVTYPVGGAVKPINTTPQELVNAQILPSPSGIGSNTVDTVGWWLTIPANVKLGNYTAQVTLAINSAL